MTRLVALLMVYVFAVIDATLLPRACRKHLKSLFTPLFDSLEAKLLAIVRAPATIAPAPPKPIPTPVTQQAKPPAQARRRRTQARPIPTSAPTETPPTAEAPHPTRAPAPNHPTRARQRALTPSTQPALPNPRNFQKSACTATHSHAHFVTIT